MSTDVAEVVTRIIPVGEKADGSALIGEPVDSAHIDEYPIVYTKQIDYDVRVDEDAEDEAERLTEAQALVKLAETAQADFDAGIDLPTVSIDADFVRLELTPEYTELANQYALHLYDTVPVTDEKSGVAASLRMTGYQWDALRERYEVTTLGDIIDISPKVYGYEIGGQISGTKILPGTASGKILRELTVGYAKMSTAAIQQLSADAITAIRADIRALVAGEITTDQLYADIAVIATACLTTANIQNASIDWATISNLTAAIASIAKAQITTANIGTRTSSGRKSKPFRLRRTMATAQITTANIQNANIDWEQVSTLMARCHGGHGADHHANINREHDWPAFPHWP